MLNFIFSLFSFSFSWLLVSFLFSKFIFGLVLVLLLIQLFSFSFSPYLGLVNIPAIDAKAALKYTIQRDTK